MIGALIFLPAVALVGSLVGLALAELPLLRSPIKALFNVGSIAIATSALVLIHGYLSAGSDRFSVVIRTVVDPRLRWPSITINLLLLAVILTWRRGARHGAHPRAMVLVRVHRIRRGRGGLNHSCALVHVHPFWCRSRLVPADRALVRLPIGCAAQRHWSGTDGWSN